MDFIEGLPPFNGHTVIMVIVDRLTKYAHFATLKHLFTAAILAKVFVANVVPLHGIPTSIISDRDSVSQFFLASTIPITGYSIMHKLKLSSLI